VKKEGGDEGERGKCIGWSREVGEQGGENGDGGERGKWKEGTEMEIKGREKRGVEGGRGKEKLKSEGQEER
jgi:hypothetical protein